MPDSLFTLGSSSAFTTDDPLFFHRLIEPALTVLGDYVRGVRTDGIIPDRAFVGLGVLRVLSQAVSGRDFLQQSHDVFSQDIKRSSFFDLLHSSRRQCILAEVNHQMILRAPFRSGHPEDDLLSAFPELRGRDIFAVDGVELQHATHALRDSMGRHVPPNTLYVLCLHRALLVNLGVVQGDGRYHHEMPVFRERVAEWLLRRPHIRGSKPPIFVADPAYVDNQFWTRMVLLKKQGAVVITRMKENMKPKIHGERPWKRESEINRGVQSDESVGFGGTCVMRRVRYIDPETGTEYEFLTTEMTLPPGLIALLYLLRWRIEKVFDTAKNKLEEKKAWATGAVSREVQAHFLALTHNLLVMLRRDLAVSLGIREEKLEKKREKALTLRTTIAAANGQSVLPALWKLPPVVQLSAQYIRAVRNAIWTGARWVVTLPRLAAMLRAYL